MTTKKEEIQTSFRKLVAEGWECMNWGTTIECFYKAPGQFTYFDTRVNKFYRVIKPIKNN